MYWCSKHIAEYLNISARFEKGYPNSSSMAESDCWCLFLVIAVSILYVEGLSASVLAILATVNSQLSWMLIGQLDLLSTAIVFEVCSFLRWRNWSPWEPGGNQAWVATKMVVTSMIFYARSQWKQPNPSNLKIC